MVDTPYPNAPGSAGSTQNLQTAIGQGNYTIDDNADGSGTNYGQNIDDSYVRSLIPGAAPALTGGGLWTSLADFRDKFHTYLQTFDLDTLKMVQPFVPGATDDDFVDTPTAATKILSSFGFHYRLGTDDFNSWIQNFYAVHATNWDTAKQNWDDYLSRVHETSAQNAADRVYNVRNWQTRKDNNDLVLRDWSHVIYAKGTSTDDATTLVGGLPTWWGAHNDNKLIIKERLGLSTTPADAPTDINATITTTNTTVSTNAAWQARKDDNDEIIRDYFHQTYPKGTTSDDATTLVGGLRTWWGAVNDNKLIRKERLGLSTLPTTQQADLGTAVAANSTAIQAGTDLVITGITGVTSSGGSTTDAQAALSGLQDTVNNIQAAVQAFAIDSTVRQTLADDFAYDAGGATNNWGPNFTVTGTGTSHLDASTLVWTASPSTYLEGAFALTTAGDHQIIKAVMASLPSTNGYNYLVGRRKADWSEFVAVKIGRGFVSLVHSIAGVEQTPLWTVAFSVNPGNIVQFELGTAASPSSNTYHVLVNGSGLAGTGGTYTGPIVDSSHRGAGLYLVNGATPGPPGNMSYFEVNDGTPATVPGTGFRAYRSNTSSAGGVTTVMPNGYYDTVDYISPDLSFTPGSPTLTVGTAGVYVLSFDVQIQGAAYGSGTGTSFPYVFVAPSGGSFIQVADGNEIDAGSIRDLAMSTILNLKVGDQVQVGASFPGSTAVGRRTGFPPPQFVMQKVA